MALDGISTPGGNITFDKPLIVANDLSVVDDLTITEDGAIGGDVIVEGTITEVGSAITKQHCLVMPGVGLSVLSAGYMPAPCNMNIVAIYAVLTEVIDGVTGNPVELTLLVNAAPHGETLLVGDETTPIGQVFTEVFTTPDTAVQDDVISVASNLTADNTGIAHVILIFEQT